MSRQILGTRLRQLREAHGLLLADATDRLGVAPSTLSRIETGRAPTRTSYLYVLLDLYQITDPDERRTLADLAREGQRDGWWTEFTDLLPTATCHYLGLEFLAASVRVFATQVIPGLLRSPGYATAVWRATTPSLDPKLLDRFLAVTCHHRQELLHREDFHLHAVLDETALRRPISTADAMTAQLDHLAELTANANITLQVLPLTTPWPVLSHPFALHAYRDPAAHDIAATSPAPGQVTITRHAARARALNMAFDKLTTAALSPDDSARCITQLARTRHR